MRCWTGFCSRNGLKSQRPEVAAILRHSPDAYAAAEGGTW